MSLNYGTIDYKNIITPTDYICTCGAKNVKLWRQYSMFLNHIELMCADCS